MSLHLQSCGTGNRHNYALQNSHNKTFVLAKAQLKQKEARRPDDENKKSQKQKAQNEKLIFFNRPFPAVP